MRLIFALSLLAAGCSAPAPPRDAAMVEIPAGPATQIGDDHAPRDERPQFALDIAAFKLDRTPVTVAQFRAFVTSTHYITEAEKFGSAGVMNEGMGGWTELDGATWEHPLGPDAPAAENTHPVTQVSWNDAVAFCQAYGLRLPSEFEWERAARLGQTPDGIVYDASTSAGLLAKIKANTWQGVFPISDTGEDGFTGTSPVGAFGVAPSGLTDMAGNVWEWTSSSYIPYPAVLNDPRTAPERVQRGGSFLCSTGGCEGFRATARSHSSPETALMHVGFRCAGQG
ncbi:MAG: SUMF1/EgtB/PvdO family nonheme iron enzyme [Hyphomonadaceae bacterium]